jgi:hypothetical protein
VIEAVYLKPAEKGNRHMSSKLVLAKGGVVIFSPEAGWQWEGWNGKVTVDASWHATLEGADIVLKSDLERLKQKLVGKSYKASGFDASPGSVLSATVTVKDSTLSDVIRCNGELAATQDTSGSFSVNCVPSMSGVPSPDPQPAKSGQWRIEKSGQALVNSS